MSKQSRRKRGRNIHGIILLDKPQGESSNASLQKVKRLLNASKAGHTGSLDPLATGVLPLCFGEATKISQFLLDSDKAYRTKIKLGIKTASGDSQSEIVQECEDFSVSEAELKKALEQFRGEIEQIPSMYSALKHEGTPLYKLARQGKSVERKVRKVTIYNLEVLSFTGREVELEIHCSKGTYVRSIADDLGDVLGCGGHVIELRRIKAGPFTLDQCITHEELASQVEKGGESGADNNLIPADLAVTDLPKVSLSIDTAFYVKQGQPVIVSHLPTEGLVRLYEEENFIGIGVILDDGRVAPKRLMLPDL